MYPNRTHAAPVPSGAIDAMTTSWDIPTRWDITSRNGISAVLWDQKASDTVNLGCGLGDDHLIYSLHLSGFNYASVELDGRTRCADALPRGSWMLVDTAGRPRAEARGRFSLLHVYIPKSLVAETCEAYNLQFTPPDHAVYRVGGFMEGSMSSAAVALEHAVADNGPLRELAVDRATNDLLIDLISVLLGPWHNQERQHLSPTSKKRVESYIKTHIDEPISLDDLAHAAGLSKFHFLRAFKADYGQTPMATVRERRLTAALDLLAGSNTSIIQIALQCGFSDHSHFSSAFRQRFGRSPTSYRRIIRGLK